MTEHVTPAEVAAVTGLGERQVWRLAREGRIPAAIVGRRFSMTRVQLAALMREGVRPADPKPEPQSMIRTFERKSA